MGNSFSKKRRASMHNSVQFHEPCSEPVSITHSMSIEEISEPIACIHGENEYDIL
jgi:hypothetical protein